jgi:hypothetical protein
VTGGALPSLAHRALDALASDAMPAGFEIAVDSRAAVDAAASLMRGRDLDGELRVLDVLGGPGSRLPRVVAAAGDAEHLASSAFGRTLALVGVRAFDPFAQRRLGQVQVRGAPSLFLYAPRSSSIAPVKKVTSATLRSLGAAARM